MNGDPSGLRVRQTAAGGLPALTLDIHRVLDEYVRHPVRAEFRFDAGAPMIVSVTFTPLLGHAVTWHIGRELLHSGLYEDSGDGDVQMWPTQFDEQKAWLFLASDEASAIFELPVAAVAEWIEASYRLVPAEAEHAALDWDGFFTDLLDGPEASPSAG